MASSSCLTTLDSESLVVIDFFPCHPFSPTAHNWPFNYSAAILFYDFLRHFNGFTTQRPVDLVVSCTTRAHIGFSLGQPYFVKPTTI